MKIQCSFSKMMDVDFLVEHPKNANKHTDAQIKLLAKLMDFQGWRHPIVVSKRSGFIVAGHGRLAAAKLNGWTEAPIDEQDFADEAAEYAFLISDNKIAELSTTDLSLVNLELENLGPDFDLELLGMLDFKLDPAENDDDKPSKDADFEEQYILAVTCKNEREMQALYEEILERGYPCKLIT